MSRKENDMGSTTTMKYLIVAEDEDGILEMPEALFQTLDEAREWLKENDGDYAIYKVNIQPI